MADIVTKKSKRSYIGDGGKPMIEVFYKGKFIDAVKTQREVEVIKKALRADEERERRLSGADNFKFKKGY